MPAPRAALAALALLLPLAACSDQDGERPAGGEGPSRPGSDGTPSAPGSAGTANAAPPSLRPEERDRAEVRAVERWAEGYARAVNAGDARFTAVADTMTAAGLDRMSRYAAGDRGRYLPGPLPVAVVAVRDVDDDHHVVDACVMSSGWSWASRTDRTTRSAQIDPVTLHLRREGGRWLIDGREGAAVDCRGVALPHRLW
jgi:hypothetical protein